MIILGLGTSQVYTHVDADTMVVRHFDATRMLHDALDAMSLSDVHTAVAALKTLGIEPVQAPITPEFTDWLVTHGGAERDYAERLTETDTLLPAIGVLMDDNTTLLVDGNNRVLKLALTGASSYFLLRYRPDAWAKYLLALSPAASLRAVRATLSHEMYEEFLKKTHEMYEESAKKTRRST